MTRDKIAPLVACMRSETAIDHVAEAYGATAEFGVRQNAALVFNDPGLSAWLAPVLTEAAEDILALTRAMQVIRRRHEAASRHAD